MYYKGVPTRSGQYVYSKTSEDNHLSSNIKVDLCDYGKFTVEIYADSSTTPRWSKSDVKVTADTYNIAPLSGSVPETSFSLRLWDKNDFRHEGPVFCCMERYFTWNWNNLPVDNYEEDANRMYGVYLCPYLSIDEMRT